MDCLELINSIDQNLKSSFTIDIESTKVKYISVAKYSLFYKITQLNLILIYFEQRNYIKKHKQLNIY